ncbi:MAG: hypothetical protein ACRDSJ_16805 [Rubrobacteraceae bacterium]
MTEIQNRSKSEEAWFKHLEFIQNAITRMARNSFLLKGWSLTLVAAAFALTINTPSVLLGLIALFPALAFWGLDAFYLRQERLFRRLYEEVSANPDVVGAFSMKTGEYENSVQSWLRTAFSYSILGFHGVVVTVVVLASVLRLVFA